MKKRKFERQIIPVFFSVDDNYVKYLAVCLKSLIDNASKRYLYHIHILNTGLKKEHKQNLDKYNSEDFIIFYDDVRSSLEDIKDSFPVRDYYSINTYFRFFIPTDFKQYDKAIYIDSDTILLQSISKLWKKNIKNYYMGVVTDRVVAQTPLFKDYTKKTLGIEPKHYFNAGVLLLNTKKLREIKILDRFVELAKFYKFKVAQDQDYFNVLCKGHVRYLSTRYNAQTFKDIPVDEKRIVLIHYNLGKKPWNDQDMPLGMYFWKYAKRTPYYDELYQHLQSYVEPVDDSTHSIADLVMDELNSDQNYWQRVRLAKLNEYRRTVLQKIEQLEWQGKFDVDVELDPPSKELLPYQIDYLRTNPFEKLIAKFAFFLAGQFLKKAIKNKQIIIKDIVGKENIENLDSGAIITCNHFSAFDSFAVQYIYFAANNKKKKFYRVIKEGNYTSFRGFYGFLMRHCNTLPLSSNQQTMKKFSRSVNTLLEKGNYVLVYPEQSMWYNYRKPRPLKDGAFHMATKANVPVLPCFITMEDSEQMDNEGYPIQEYTIHIMKPIYPNPELSNRENINKMKEQNSQDWKECYENFYHKKLD